MTHRFVLEPDQHVERIDKVVTRLFPDASRAAVQRWISEGKVRVDGRPCRASTAVSAGAVVEVEPLPPPPSVVQPDPSVPFGVLYEDEFLIVVDKPAGVVVHPGRGNHDRTLVAGLLARPGFERPPTDPIDPEAFMRPGIVHRLDKNTSGALVAAKEERAREGLKAQLAAHAVERIYYAITVGVPAEGRIETLHARHRAHRARFTSFTDVGRGAVTNVNVKASFGGKKAAWVSCRLETGRTHQIRVHLAEQRSTPILADSLYGKLPSDQPLCAIARRLGRQALHAAVLGFEHPIDGRALRFEAPLPEDMQQALASLRALG